MTRNSDEPVTTRREFLAAAAVLATAPLLLPFRGIRGATGSPGDTVRGDVVVVELKTAKNYNSDDEPQLLNELKATGIKVGLLVNFGRTKVEFKRMVF